MSGFGFLMGIAMVALYAFILVTAWRFMRAHESIAESLKSVAEKMQKEP